ncbi:MAG: hypothetical protein GY853_01720 [PVC group bacterium]|nr:hypothetical protein [PVC group bacterium]
MIDPYNFIKVLTKNLPEDAIVVCANGTPCVTMFQEGVVKKGQRIFWNSGCAAMGYALPAAIGAHYASGKEVICIEGDGSLMFNLQELQTIDHHELPIKLFVFNNGGYHSIKETQDVFFKGDYHGSALGDVSFPDWEEVAETFNFPYFVMDGDDRGVIAHFPFNKFKNVFIEVKLGEYKFRRQEL